MGLGERAGNTCLEQIATVIALYGSEELSCKTQLNLKKIPELCQQISQLARSPIPAAAPIIGKNTFRHKSGMHQDGILKKTEVYQDIPPALVGRPIELELRQDSGWAGISYCAERLGFKIPSRKRKEVFAAFKSLAEQIGTVEDEDLYALLSREIDQAVLQK